MRILFIQGGFGSGGAEKIVAMLAHHRAALGDDVHVAGAECPPEGSYYEYHETVTLHVQNKKSRGPTQWRRFSQIRSLVLLLKPDVIVTFLTKVNVLTLLATVGRATPVIISERNNPFAQGGNRLWTRLQSFLSRNAFAIVLQTEAIRADLGGPAMSKGRVIANPCEPIGEIGRVAGPVKRLAAVGRLTHQKGFDTLIDAMPTVVKSHPEIVLTIYGDGPDRKALEFQVAAHGLESFVKLPGTTTRPGSWIEQADLLIAPSRYEGFPNVVAEAAVAGLPVVATDCKYGPSEMISDRVNGWLVPVDDSMAIATAISKFVTTPEYLSELPNEAARVRARLDSSKILKAWDALIDEATSGAKLKSTVD